MKGMKAKVVNKYLYLLIGIIFNSRIYAQDQWQVIYQCFLRQEQLAGILNNKIYTGFGRILPGVLFNDWYEVDVTTNNCLYKNNNLPTAYPYYGGVSVTFSNVIYIGLGIDNFGQMLSDWWMYNTSTNQWIQKQSFSGTKRMDATGNKRLKTILLKDTIYLVGGIDSNGIFRKDIWKYFPGTDMWDYETDYPDSTLLTAFAYKNSIYLMDASLNLWKYENKQWSFIPASISNLCLTSRDNILIGNRVYFINCNCQMIEYNIDTQAWTLKSNYPGNSCINNPILSGNNSGYILPGEGYTAPNNSTQYNDIWIYFPDTLTYVKQQEIHSKCIIYPNPCGDDLFLNTSLENIDNVIVSDIIGNQITCDVQKLKDNMYKVDVRSLVTGVYFLFLKEKDNTIFKTKIIKR